MLKKVIAIIFLSIIISMSVGGVAPAEKTNVIVVFKENPTSDDIGFFKNQGGDVKFTYSIIPGAAIELPTQAYDNIKSMCSDSKNPANARCARIDYIEIDQEVHLLSKPSGSGTIISQPVQVTPWGITRVNAPSAWLNSTGKNITIAVIDTGIDYNHPDLKTNVIGGISFVRKIRSFMDDNGHGTHVAGTIAALNNSIGVVGVAPDAKLLGVKVLDRTGSGYMSWVIAGIDWAADPANNVDVITMSLGGGPSEALNTSVNNAYKLGIVVVAAAGNENGAIIYPAAYASAIAVTATDSSNIRASFSNYGPEAELAAPGVSIYSTWKGGGYNTISGTSMATPHVTGVVALMLANPESCNTDDIVGCTPSEVRTKLQNSAKDLGDSGWDKYFGYGLVNAYNALN